MQCAEKWQAYWKTLQKQRPGGGGRGVLVKLRSPKIQMTPNYQPGHAAADVRGQVWCQRSAPMILSTPLHHRELEQCLYNDS